MGLAGGSAVLGMELWEPGWCIEGFGLIRYSLHGFFCILSSRSSHQRVRLLSHLGDLRAPFRVQRDWWGWDVRSERGVGDVEEKSVEGVQFAEFGVHLRRGVGGAADGFAGGVEVEGEEGEGFKVHGW